MQITGFLIMANSWDKLWSCRADVVMLVLMEASEAAVGLVNLRVVSDGVHWCEMDVEVGAVIAWQEV